MKENSKAKKIALWLIGILFLICAIIAVFSTRKWIVSGNQRIRISTAQKAYVNSDLYLTVSAYPTSYSNTEEIESKTKVTLLDARGKQVKDVKYTYNHNDITLGIPNIEPGNYFIKATVSSKLGTDTIKKMIYLSNENQENVTISFDKGIYKPGDEVMYRALITGKQNDEPVCEEANVSIYDGNGNKVYHQDVITSDYGILSGSFQLADEVNSGIYQLTVKTDHIEATKEFKVNPYVLPKYEVQISFDKEQYLVGEQAKITLSANYFFGEAVSNAKYAVYINGEKYRDYMANESGVKEINYSIQDAKTYTVSVEAVDSSNYYVEATNTFTAGTDLFEIELVPEFGTLVAGNKNDIYVFTKKADGTPIKTYITVSASNYTRQVATDENGIGKFSIDIDSIGNTTSRYSYNQQSENRNFNITAQDMEGNTVQKQITLEVENRDLLITTDKVKYQEGEEIKLNILSSIEGAKELYFFKNNELIKILTTDSDEAKVNLNDTYGLIDIYVRQRNNNDYSYYSSYRQNNNLYQYKRTIFIKPERALNIEVAVDKEEYLPGEDIHIVFQVADEVREGVDAALLVSMVDNSVLNLASNDLSMDNIKLALEGITFSEELDAATLYSCIMDDTKEDVLTYLLLKSAGNSANISTETIRNDEGEDRAEALSVCLYIVLTVLLIAFLCIRFKKLRSFLRNCITHGLTYFILTISIYYIIYSLLDYYTSLYDFEIGFFITAGIFLILYVFFISKAKLLRTSISIAVLFVVYECLGVLDYEFDVPVPIALLILIVLFILVIIVCAIIDKIRKSHKIMVNIKRELQYIMKLICTGAVSLFIGFLLDKVLFMGEGYLYSRYYRYDWHESIVIPVAIIALYILHYFLGLRKRKKIKLHIEIENGAETENGSEAEPEKLGVTGGVIVSILVVLAVLFGIYLFSSTSSITNTGRAQIDAVDWSSMNDDRVGIPSIVPDVASSPSSIRYGRIKHI